jgi:hypothetical protein
MARSYRFADSSRPGLLLGLSGRQAIPLIIGVVTMALTLQTTAPALVALVGPVVGVVVAFGRVRGVPLGEVTGPAAGLWWTRRRGRARWVRASLVAGGTRPDGAEVVPNELQGLELLDVPSMWGPRPKTLGVVHDRRAGTVTGVVSAHAEGFGLAGPDDQDVMLSGWGGALAPFARERTPVTRVCWQEWAHPIGVAAHRQFLDEHDLAGRAGDPGVADYVALIEAQAATTVTHQTLLSVTVDLGRVRRRRSASALEAAVEVLVDELRLFADRLGAAGIAVEGPLSSAEVAATVRTRSDPTRAAAVATLSSSLASAAGKRALEWGPMATDRSWSHVRVDGSIHRSYRVATWPMLPVGADWLAPLLGGSGATRTVTVVFEPVPTSRAARLADREVMSREADAEMKERRGFRVSERDRKRIEDVRRRETELTQGHPEFRFVGLVDVTATDLDELDDGCAAIEQAAAQSLIDLRPLDARHHLGWVASLPLGRSVTSSRSLT